MKFDQIVQKLNLPNNCILINLFTLLELLKKILRKALIIGTLLTIGINIGSYFLLYQRTFLGRYSKHNHFPYRHPCDRKLPFKDIQIKSGSQTLAGWFIPQPQSLQVPTVIFYHENAGSWRLDYLERYYHQVHCNLIIVAYSGYDESTGFPTESQLKQDGQSIFTYSIEILPIDKSKVYLHGRSLGGAVAAYTAFKQQQEIKGLILENTFTSVKDVVTQMNPLFKLIGQLYFCNRWVTKNIIPFILVPTLFISSGQDEIVPYSHMQHLSNLSQNKVIYHIPQGNHNENWVIDKDRYFKEISKFITV